MHWSRALVAQLRCPQPSSRTAVQLQLQPQARNVRPMIRVAEHSLQFEAAAAGDTNGACALQLRQAAHSPFFARTAEANEGHAGRRLQLDAGILKLQQRDGT